MKFMFLIVSFVVVSTLSTEAADKAHKFTIKDHEHQHAEGCGHEAVAHGDHQDYLHDGQYHAKHGGHYDLHGTPVSK